MKSGERLEVKMFTFCKNALICSAITLSLSLFSQVVHASTFSVTGTDVSTPLPLTGYVGTAASLPAQFTTDATGGYQGVFTSGSSTYSTTNGLYEGLSSV